MPSWLAPNLITLLGLIAIYINIFTILILIPDLSSPAPSWTYYSFAAGLFFYQTMDNIDGKQARKTGSSSPLGELFDHGVDALNCCLGGLVQSVCMGMGSGPSAAAIALCTCIAMYLSTWETYHTHTLYLGYLNGPTEGIIIAVSLMLVSGYYGPQVWKQNLVDIVPVTSIFVSPTFTLSDLWVFAAVAGVFVGHLPVCLYNVYNSISRDQFKASLNQLLPIGLLSVATYSWLLSPNSCILPNNHLVLFCLTISFVFCRVTTSIILAHLTRQPFPYWSVPMYPLFIGGIVFRIIPGLTGGWFELTYLWLYFAFMSVYFSIYSTRVVGSICRFLGIECLRIRKAVNLNDKSM